jgi:hypothetical protein
MLSPADRSAVASSAPFRSVTTVQAKVSAADSIRPWKSLKFSSVRVSPSSAMAAGAKAANRTAPVAVAAPMRRREGPGMEGS